MQSRLSVLLPVLHVHVKAWALACVRVCVRMSTDSHLYLLTPTLTPTLTSIPTAMISSHLTVIPPAHFPPHTTHVPPTPSPYLDVCNAEPTVERACCCPCILPHSKGAVQEPSRQG